MEFEHAKTDAFFAKFEAALGPNNGIVAVKQNGSYSGTGPFLRPKPDFFEFPSGMQVSTDAVAWNEDWFDWYLSALAAQEKQLFDTREQHMDLRDGKTVTKPVERMSPCLDKFR